MPPDSEVIALPGRPARTPKPQFLSALAERALRARLDRITDGELLIEHAGSIARYGRPGAERPVSLRVHDRRFWTEVAFGGSIGAGESYVQGDCGAIENIYSRHHYVGSMPAAAATADTTRRGS